MTLFKWVLIGWLLIESVGQVYRIANPGERPSITARWATAIVLALFAFWALAVIP